jgi:ABC-type glycerol-3-phosphate transport system substrate-binding protein
MVQSTGSEMYIQDKNVNKNDAKVREAFSFYCALQKDNASEFPQYYDLNANDGKAPGSYTSGSSTSEQQLFIQQRCFSIFNGLYAFPAYDFYNLNFEFGIAPHPVMDKSKGAFGTTSAMVNHAISKTTKYADIAWEFLEFYQTHGIEQFAKIAYNIPGNKTIAGSDNFLKNDNPKIEKLTNYFYNFVLDGHCAVTKYNSLIAYDRIETCFNTQLAKYYNGAQSFESLLTEIDKAINASI